MSENRIVVDTDVVSYIFNKHTQADYFIPRLSHKSLAVAFMTIAQLYYGVYKAMWGTQRIARLENHLKNYVVLPYDYSVCLKWAEIRKQCENDRFPIEQSDCWVAACALRYDCSLATNNGKHFEHIKDLDLIAPGFM